MRLLACAPTHLKRTGKVYYEPHNDVDLRRKLPGVTSDIVICPVKEQVLPMSFTLVHGADKAIELAKHLEARALIPLRNGEIVSSGLLSDLLESEDDFAAVRRKFENVQTAADRRLQFVDNQPGVPVVVPVAGTA